MTEKEIFIEAVHKWVKGIIADITGNKPFITPMYQQAAYNKLSRFESYADYFFDKNDKLDDSMVENLLFPFNEDTKPMSFNVLGSEITIENGVLKVPVKLPFVDGDVIRITKRDVTDLIDALKKELTAKI